MATELVLEGLDCANCAAKIEEKVNGIMGIKTASVNFVNKTLVFETNVSEQQAEILSEIKTIVNKVEPSVVIKDSHILRTDKKVFTVLGLDCANCAAKIETKVANIGGVTSATVDFASGKLAIEIGEKSDLNRIVQKITDTVKEVEPNAIVNEEAKTSSLRTQTGKADSKKTYELVRLSVSTLLFGFALLVKFPFWVQFALYLISYLLVGGEVLKRAFKNIVRGQVFDENFLMAVATIGAFAIKQFPEGVAVMLFYNIGEFLQGIAVNRSRKSIAALMDIRPDYANLQVGSDIKRVSPEEVSIGDLIVVKAGEKIPLDGIVEEGKSFVDTSALTGESVPREVSTGSEVLAGFINRNGLLNIKVTKGFGESTVTKILDLVQNASSRKAPTENFITKFARYYTPAVVLIAGFLALVPPLVIPGATFSQWVYRSLVFLVVSCPCALVVSIPLGFFGGIGGASRQGILVKGSNYLEALNNVDIVVFDKTGTLTKGVFKVTEICPRNEFDQEELLQHAAYAEVYSNHPIAASILKAYGRAVDKSDLDTYDEVSGYGIKATIKGTAVLAGNSKLMVREGINPEEITSIGTVVHIAVNQVYAGYIVISDEVKEDSLQTLRELKKLGVRKTVMLTGDSMSVATRVAEQLGFDEVFAELLPHEKVEKVEVLEKQKSPKGNLLFVGDGINDAPVLARADIGVAMGGLGSDAAIEAADIVIMTDEPSKLANGMIIAKRTRNIVLQNIVFALVIKILVLVLGAGGIATIWEAVFADVGVTLIAVLNAMRVVRVTSV